MEVEPGLANGPAKLCQAMEIDRKLDGCDLTRSDGELFIERLRKRTYAGEAIGVSERIGVEYAEEWAKKLLRFYLRGNGYVSR